MPIQLAQTQSAITVSSVPGDKLKRQLSVVDMHNVRHVLHEHDGNAYTEGAETAEAFAIARFLQHYARFRPNEALAEYIRTFILPEG